MRKAIFFLLGFFVVSLLGTSVLPGASASGAAAAQVTQMPRKSPPPKLVDFEITLLRVDAPTNGLYATLRNSTGVYFDGKVTFWIKLEGTTKKHTTDVVFEGNPTWEVLLPTSSTTNGTHTVRITIDPFNEVPEQNESNNTYSQAVKFVGELSFQDLTISALYRSGPKIYYTVKNAAKDNFCGDIVVLPNLNNRNYPHIVLSNITLQPEQSETRELNIALTPGRNIITLTVDPFHKLAETNERNNSIQKEFYPAVTDISLVKYATVGKGRTVAIATKTNPKVVIRPQFLTDTGGVNWGIEVTTQVRGEGTQPFSAYSIDLACFFGNSLKTQKTFPLTNGPCNGDAKDDILDFFIPKKYCKNGEKGVLNIHLVINGVRQERFQVNIEFSGF